jgi:hypothetical protein
MAEQGPGWSGVPAVRGSGLRRHRIAKGKIMNAWKISTAAFAVAFATSLSVNLFSAGVSADEKQPHMNAALKELDSAHKQLMEAAHDKEGHRKEAAKLTEKAIDETKKGIEAGEDGGK